MAEGGCGGNPAMPERIELSPRHLPEYLEGRTPKKNALSFLEEVGRAQIRKARNIFLWCPPRLCEAVAGRFIPRQDYFQKRFEFCTMNAAIFRKGFRNQ